MRKKLLILLLTAIATFSTLWAENSDSLLRKSQLMVQKGIKAQQRGDIEEAVSCFEEAYQAYPKNILPLIHWGRCLCDVGMYERASELLQKIPLEKLKEAGRAQVLLLMAKVAIESGSVEEAASFYSKALKAHDKNLTARVRLAAVNLMLGFESQAVELFAGMNSFTGLPVQEQKLALLVDLQLGNFLRAYNNSSELLAGLSPQNYPEEEEPFLFALWKVPLITLAALFPITAGIFYQAVYYLFLFGFLVFLANNTASVSKAWHSIVFIVLAMGFLLGMGHFIRHDLLLSALKDGFSANDSFWIIPRILVSGHFVALALLIVFPSFRMLPEELRPRGYEFYGIWFFCWWFMAFVLVFQSRLGFGPRLAYMVATFAGICISVFFMPLGRFILFSLSNLTGSGRFADVSRRQLDTSSGISFTDTKILETKAWKLIEQEEFEEAVLIARKVFSSLDRSKFPGLWRAQILALIAREDYVEAHKNLGDFLKQWKGSSVYESGLLLEAFLRAEKGDFASALKTIRALPEDRVRSFSPDEHAISLLTLGRCDIAYNDNVQAHIDLSKAFNCARLSFIKSSALLELTDLDCRMNAQNALQKWMQIALAMNKGSRTVANGKCVLSICSSASGKGAEALKLAEEACKEKMPGARVLAWYGHLLCKAGRHNEAESLLNRMPPESYDTNQLMTEVTS